MARDLNVTRATFTCGVSYSRNRHHFNFVTFYSPASSIQGSWKRCRRTFEGCRPSIRLIRLRLIKRHVARRLLATQPSSLMLVGDLKTDPSTVSRRAGKARESRANFPNNNTAALTDANPREVRDGASRNPTVDRGSLTRQVAPLRPGESRIRLQFERATLPNACNPLVKPVVPFVPNTGDRVRNVRRDVR